MQVLGLRLFCVVWLSLFNCFYCLLPVHNIAAVCVVFPKKGNYCSFLFSDGTGMLGRIMFAWLQGWVNVIKKRNPCCCLCHCYVCILYCRLSAAINPQGWGFIACATNTYPKQFVCFNFLVLRPNFINCRSSLDCDAKRWRLFADMLNDFAICLEISAPFFPAWFTFIVCISGVCKVIRNYLLLIDLETTLGALVLGKNSTASIGFGK